MFYIQWKILRGINLLFNAWLSQLFWMSISLCKQIDIIWTKIANLTRQKRLTGIIVISNISSNSQQTINYKLHPYIQPNHLLYPHDSKCYSNDCIVIIYLNLWMIHVSDIRLIRRIMLDSNCIHYWFATLIEFDSLNHKVNDYLMTISRKRLEPF